MSHGPWHASDLLEGEKAERKSSDIVLIRRLYAYLAPHKSNLAVGVVFLLITSGANLAGPYLLKTAIDTFITAKDFSGLTMITIAFIAVSLIQFISQNRQLYIMSAMGQKMIYQMRRDMFARLQILSLKFFSENETGRVMSRLTNDLDGLQELLTSGILTTLSDIVTIVGIIAIMTWMSPQLTLVAITIVPMVLGVIFFFQKKAKTAYLETKRKIAGVYATLQQSISGMRVIQSYTREADNQQTFGQVNVENLQANLVAARFFAFLPSAMDIISAVGTAIVLWYGSLQAFYGVITIGTIVAFMAYLTMSFRPLMELSIFYTNFQSAMAGAERMFELLDSPVNIKERTDAIQLLRISGEINFDNVSFGYDPRQLVLRNINIRIAPNETIAIVGPTGAGKTSMINLLCRFYDPTDGSIKVNGHDLRYVKLESLHRQMGLVLQDPFLFSGTVRENIRYGRLDATDEEVEMAAKSVGAHDFIQRLPKEYDTLVQEGATNLSIGQRQLISFARALLADPRILIMDEATSSVDPYTELIIRQALEALLKSRTSIIIAHRLSTVRNADRIIALDHGQIVEEGTHDELLEKDGLYARLYRMQFRDAEEIKPIIHGSAE
ncbi:MAG: ABC transporter ATP-binding protein [archaeon]